jgi:pyruvate dehydrogenase E1 component beta subunit
MFKAKTLISYVETINAVAFQGLTKWIQSIFIGKNMTSPWYIGLTCITFHDKFCVARVNDTPISENAVAGTSIRTTRNGSKTIVVRSRLDFMKHALCPITNLDAKCNYMFNGTVKVTVVI